MHIRNRLCKTSLVVSVLVFAAEAHAQSSVTLYGLLDGGMLYVNKTQNATGGNGGKLLTFSDSGWIPSQWGLTGVENLGAGLLAEFKLESGISIANGGFNNSNGNAFGRQAYVGLKGDFGEVKAGLVYSPFFLSLLHLDSTSFSDFGSGLAFLVNNVVTTSIFNSNAVLYTSPVIGGLQGSVYFAFGGKPGDFSAGRQYSANLSYRWNGLLIEMAYFNGNPGSAVQTPVPSTIPFEGRTIGAGYTIGNLTAKASFTNYKVTGSGMNNNVYAGGLDYRWSPALDLKAGVWYATNRDNSSSNSLMGSLGAFYSLSVRTALYVQAGVVRNRGSANVGLDVDNQATVYAPTGTTFGANVGLRHSF